MKCLIHCPVRDVKWVERYFPDQPPYLLPIANKPYLEYLIEYCVLNQIKSILITTGFAEQHLDKQLGDGSRWGIEISYALLPVGLPISEIYLRFARALADDDLLIFEGMFWLSYDKRKPTIPVCRPDSLFRYGSHCWMLGRNFNHGQIESEDNFQYFPQEDMGISSLGSIQEFYHRSMSLVRGEADNYSMPTYSASPNVYIGQNVSIARTASVLPPVHLGNIVQIGENCKIGPNVVIGENTFIDDDTIVRDSVIEGNSYIGSNLEIIGKIVHHNMLINPESGVKLSVHDDFMFTPISGEKRPRCSFAQQVSAVLLWMVMVLPYLLIRPWVSLKCCERVYLLNRHEKISLSFGCEVDSRFHCLKVWFQKLSLDRFPLLFQVFHGRLRLVGNRLVTDTPDNEEMLKHFPIYAPGLFSYSEMLEHADDPLQSELDELFYLHHMNFRINWEILYRTLFGNLFREVK